MTVTLFVCQTVNTEMLCPGVTGTLTVLEGVHRGCAVKPAAAEMEMEEILRKVIVIIIKVYSNHKTLHPVITVTICNILLKQKQCVLSYYNNHKD